MEYKNLGKSNLKVSAVGLGTGFRGGITKNSHKVIEAALDLGVTLIDTAEIYEDGRSEKLVGQVIKDRRDEVVLVTKVSGDHLRYDDVLKAAEGSLKRLGVDYIDLYLVHWPNTKVPLGETMRAMETLVKQGKIRYIGVSNFDATTLKEARQELSRHEIIADEVKYNLMEPDIETDILPYCQKEGIGIIAYGSLARGLLTGRFTDDSDISKDDWRSQDWFFKDENFANGLQMVEALKEEGKKCKKTPGQIAISWLLSKPMVTPIFGASSVEQVKENCGAVGWRINEQTRFSFL
ncbi:aldo/keto reductase [Candidatus Bathyarchaeota archaeon]|nr:aldo/keto reductase [Candidatus Bathyarchaeota archaeon]